MNKSSLLLIAATLVSCVPQQQTVISETKPLDSPTPSQDSVNHIAVTESVDLKMPIEPQPLNTEGLRLPSDMLGLPQDEQLRSAPGTRNEGKATVIARPPEQ